MTSKWLQGITLFKDFETILFAFLLNSLNDHYICIYIFNTFNTTSNGAK